MARPLAHPIETPMNPAVRQAQDERAERTRITADMVVQERALHAFGRMGRGCGRLASSVTRLTKT